MEQVTRHDSMTKK